jgi:hypothetical protein
MVCPSWMSLLYGCETDGWTFAAKLAISIARKMNALIFLVPEDIVDVRPRLVCSSPLPPIAN